MGQSPPFDFQGNPLDDTSSETFSDWSGQSIERRLIARTRISATVAVSTLCLGPEELGQVGTINGEPRLYETMIVGGARDGHVWRYATLDLARTDHASAVALALGDEA